VEDEPLVANELVEWLRTWGYTVAAVVRSGPAAIEAARRTAIDLVLIDIVLAGDVSGIITAKTLRDLFGLPIVFVTGHDGQVLDQAKLTDPYGYVLKPFAPRQLRATIELALHRRQVEQLQAEGSRPGREVPAADPRAAARASVVLTGRELAVLKLLARGLSTKPIARELGISAFTARNHATNVLAKLGAHSRLEAVSLALSAGLLTAAGPDEPGDRDPRLI
jgi:DNA-binding NarL/FixJ family response regulator